MKKSNLRKDFSFLVCCQREQLNLALILSFLSTATEEQWSGWNTGGENGWGRVKERAAAVWVLFMMSMSSTKLCSGVFQQTFHFNGHFGRKMVFLTLEIPEASKGFICSEREVWDIWNIQNLVDISFNFGCSSSFNPLNTHRLQKPWSWIGHKWLLCPNEQTRELKLVSW